MKTQTESNQELPVVISDREILHKASFNSGPQITRVQVIEYRGKRTEVNFWTENGKLVRVA